MRYLSVAKNLTSCYTFLNLQTFNAVLGRLNMRDLISRYWTTRDQVAREDIARPDNAAPDQTEVDSFFCVMAYYVNFVNGL